MSDVTLHVSTTPMTVKNRLLMKTTQTGKAVLLKANSSVSFFYFYKRIVVVSNHNLCTKIFINK